MSVLQLLALYNPDPDESKLALDGLPASAKTAETTLSGFNLMLSFLGGRNAPLSKVLFIIQEAAQTLLPEKDIEGDDQSELFLERAMLLSLRVSLFVSFFFIM